jgi:hypothetical protein
MAKTRIKNTVTKTEGSPKLIVQELNILSADRSSKDIGSFKNALQSAESIWNPNRVLLYDMYNDCLLDGHLSGIINKRIDAVLNKEIYFEDAKGERLDALNQLIDSELFREIIRKILETQLWGISGLEFIPGSELKYREIPRKHIRPEAKKIVFEQYGDDGVVYEDISNIWIMGKADDLGLLLKCSPYALYKKGTYGDWAQYVEIFGQPVRVVKYDAYDEKTKLELRQVLDESGSSLALMIPKQADFEMKDGKQSNGDGQLQERFKTSLDNEMSVIILGNTETTTSSRSSGYAQAKEMGKQQIEITKSDIKYVRSFLNSDKFLGILKSYGYPVDGGSFSFEIEIDLNELKTRLEIDEALASKVPIDDDYWYANYGLSKPNNYDALKKEMEERKSRESEEGSREKKEGEKPNSKPQAPSSKTKLKVEESLFFKLRATLADFFDQPR